MSQAAADQALNAEVAKYVSKGFAVESAMPGQTILAKKNRIGLFWNVVLTVITGGLWLIVILYKVLNRKSSRVVLYVDGNGRVQRR